MSLSAADIRTARFAQTKFREGYVAAEVDALLERAAAALDARGGGIAAAGALTADDVTGARFGATKFSPGYDQDQVDDFLDQVASALRVERSGAPAPVSLLAADAAERAARAVRLDGPGLRVRAAALVRHRLRAGYAVTEVDAFVEEVAGELDRRARSQGPRLTADDVLLKRFTATAWRTGYRQDGVDDLLDDVVGTLRGSD